MNYKSYKKEALVELNKAKKNILDSIGAFVETEAKLRATEDTGTLRRSINFVTEEKDNKVTIGTNVEYAEYVELGTSKQEAQPYLTPAVEENIKDIESIAKDYYKKIK